MARWLHYAGCCFLNACILESTPAPRPPRAFPPIYFFAHRLPCCRPSRAAVADQQGKSSNVRLIAHNFVEGSQFSETVAASEEAGKRVCLVGPPPFFCAGLLGSFAGSRQTRMSGLPHFCFVCSAGRIAGQRRPCLGSRPSVRASARNASREKGCHSWF